MMICQSDLPIKPWLDPRDRRMPGLRPVPISEWLVRDDACRQQIRLRTSLLATMREHVLETGAGRMDTACEELLDCVARTLIDHHGFTRMGEGLVNADGESFSLQGDHPLALLAPLVQEDFTILQRENGEDEYRLWAGLLCFPASWMLSEKIGRGLLGIHAPVPSFDQHMSNRVTRILDHLDPETPLMRANYLIYTDPALYQPRHEGVHKPIIKNAPRFIRVERQVLRKLNNTGAVVFSIHTYVVPASSLSAVAYEELCKHRPELDIEKS